MRIGTVVLDRYAIEAELGSGTMGVVYRGRHVKLPRDVAIKIMHEHLTGEPVLLERFRREGQACGKLAHPNVVSVLDVGELADGRPVMVMELATGVSLGDLMDQLMTRERIFGLIAQLLRGLDHAHAAGIVHRDLKPENVIVEADDVARIVDFGIAALRGTDEELQRLTGTGVIIGTPLYMAPEQAMGERVDHRADLYALGIILYELLSGKAPFAGTAMEVATMKIDRDPPPIVGLDPLLARYLNKLIARDPNQRFATAHAALEVLELIDRDPAEAAGRLGIIDVAKALALISLP